MARRRGFRRTTCRTLTKQPRRCIIVTALHLEVDVATNPIRVPESVHTEVHAAARVLGCNAAELLERAWDAFRQTPEFRADFEFAQKAFVAGDLDAVAHRMQEHATERARRRASAVKTLRR